MPLLKRNRSSVAQSNCLRNTPRWESMDEFVAEYQVTPVIADDTMLRQLTGVDIIYKGDPPMPLADYAYFLLAGPSLKQHFADLLSRKSLGRWLYAVFFKLALPMNCPTHPFSHVVISPLNMTIFFRLLAQLRLLGYPSHWLSESLLHILSNTVVTTARPPRTIPLTPADITRPHPAKHLSTTPFIHEAATLTRLFEPLLPFSLSPTTDILPSLQSIYEYEIHQPHYVDRDCQYCNLVLVFWNAALLPRPCSVMELRQLLDPSWGEEVEAKFKGEEVRRFREEGVRLWSSFRWDTCGRVARAWIPEGMVAELGERGWCCGLWRTDLWEPAFWEASPVVKVVRRGRAWME